MARWHQEQRVVETTLYRLFSVTDVLLYVGITKNLTRRFGEHAVEKPWWHQCHHYSTVVFPNRWEATWAESEAIRTQSPLYNRHQNDHRTTGPRAMLCAHCWYHGADVLVDPWDDTPDDASWEHRSAYFCGNCRNTWTADWDYFTGGPLPYGAYQPWELHA